MKAKLHQFNFKWEYVELDSTKKKIMSIFVITRN